MQRIIFFTILFLITFLLQLLVLNSFRKFFSDNNSIRKRINIILMIIILYFNIPYLLLILLRLKISELPELVNYIYVLPLYIYLSTIVFMGIIILITKLIKLPLILASFILKRFKLIREKIIKLKKQKSIVKFENSRRTFIKYSGLFLAGYAFAGSGIGIISKDKYEILNKTIKLKNLPAGLKGLKIVLFSDIHAGPYMQESTMNKYADVVNTLNADIILIPGDITNSIAEEALSFSKSFKHLNSKFGVYATLGNHDYFSSPNEIQQIIEDNTSIKLLRNKAEILSINGINLCILGSEDTRDSGAGNNAVIKGYIEQTISDAKEKAKLNNITYDSLIKILLCHKPYVFDYIDEFNIDLMLSGHTHGGQIIFASAGELNFSIASAVSKYVAGYYNNGSTNLYISRGIGTVGLPLRVNCPPEITIIKLE